MQQESEEFGNAYIWSSGVHNATAGDTVLLIKNTADGLLHIDRVLIANGSTASRYDIHIPSTIVATPAGTANTGTNLNTTSGNTANAVAKVDETTNSQGDLIGQVYMAVDTNYVLDLRGLFLGKNESIGVDVAETASETSVTIYGHYIKYVAGT